MRRTKDESMYRIHLPSGGCILLVKNVVWELRSRSRQTTACYSYRLPITTILLTLSYQDIYKLG